MTADGGDGKRYLVRRDGTLVKEGGTVRLDDLDPASARIVKALVALDESVKRRSNSPHK